LNIKFYEFLEVDEKERQRNEDLKSDLLLIARIREERQKVLSSGNLLPSNEKRSDSFNRLAVLLYI